MLEAMQTPSTQGMFRNSFRINTSVAMKRLSAKQKRWQIRHAKRSARRRLRRRGHHAMVRDPGQIRLLLLPKTLSFKENYDETITFFNNLREASERRIPLKIDFTTLRYVGPAAALVLAAELDSWRLMGRHRIRVLDIDRWNQDIRHILDEMGLFELIRVANPPPDLNSSRPSIRFIRFKSSDVADGELATDLRTDLEVVTGQIPGWQHLYRGLAEAMTNVRQHAYSSDSHGVSVHSNTRKWWMGGAYDDQRKVLTCSFFDRGVGIPATLPRTHAWERIREFLKEWSLSENDASLIAAATAMGRTSTGAEHQGRGLADVKEFVKRSGGGGRLRILSRQGQYIYEGEGKEERTSLLSSSIGGTLIEWEVTLP